jgi:hypothetical protein
MRFGKGLAMQQANWDGEPPHSRLGGRLPWNGFFRFWAACAALYLTDRVVGSLSIRPLSAIVLALVLAAVGLVVDALWPGSAPGGPGLSGWVTAAAVLYGAQRVVPFYHVTVFGAIVAGGLVWLLDQITPIVFG